MAVGCRQPSRMSSRQEASLRLLSTRTALHRAHARLTPPLPQWCSQAIRMWGQVMRRPCCRCVMPTGPNSWRSERCLGQLGRGDFSLEQLHTPHIRFFQRLQRQIMVSGTAAQRLQVKLQHS